MLDAGRRGEMAGAELAKEVDKRLSRLIWIPSLVIEILARWTFRQYKRKGYGHIEPESEFVRGFVTRFQRERTIIFD